MVPDLLFKEIHRHKKADLPFVVYRFPNSSHFKTWLQFDDVLTTTTEFEAEGFVFAPYNRHAHAVLFKKEHCQIFETAIEPIREEHSGYRGQIDLSFKEAYQKMVQKAVDTIQHSDLQKVVLSRAFEIEMTSADNLDLFLRLASRYRNAFVYYWYHPKVGTWMGATPELLMQISRNRLTTVSLAGTLRADQKLNWTPKEKDEQKLVTEYIVSQLEPLANTITTGDTKEITAGKLKHLKTEISASLKLADQGLKEVILALHPTPAVCGYPKELAQKFIESNEGYDRSYYTGFLGEINCREERTRSTQGRNTEAQVYKTIIRNTRLYVNLRCLRLEEKTGTVFVGGGIVNSSDPDKEWQETVDKSSTMLRIL